MDGRNAPLRIGILALQGDVAEHARILRTMGLEPLSVRLPEQLEGLDGLILPGGESTTIGQLAVDYGLIEPIRSKIEAGMPAWGTCAGLILLARDAGRAQALIGGMDLRVDRNAFGRQVDSFETDLEIAGIAGGPFRTVFIRAPLVAEVGPGVAVLAQLGPGRIVAVQQGLLLGTSFHPELTDDPRLHAHFVDICRRAAAQNNKGPGRLSPFGP
jgi:5'-phosphate synthase pdxT subunit